MDKATSRSLPWVLVASCHERVRMAPVVVSGSAYSNAVRLTGCRPLVVPGAEASDLDALLDLADGILFTGSPSNVDPLHFGETVLDPELPLDPSRDQWTLPLIRAALERDVPFLAICRGCQEFNVALGGSLHQAVHRLPGMLDHRPAFVDSLDAKYGPAHEITLTSGGLLERILGETRVTVNSVHGQGIHRLASDLRAEAHAPDGLVEAVTVPNASAFNLGVQWHPEWRAAENPVSRRIFDAFGNACRDRRSRRNAAPPRTW